MRYGEKVKLLLDRRGWRPAQLARKADVSRTTVARWIRDGAQPYDDSLPRVASVFGVPVDYLTDDAQDEPPAGEIRTPEQTVLAVYRSLGLDEETAIRALTLAAAARDGNAAVVESIRDNLDPPAARGRRRA